MTFEGIPSMPEEEGNPVTVEGSDPEMKWFKSQALEGAEEPLYPGVMNRMKGVWESSSGNMEAVVEGVNEYIEENGLDLPEMSEMDVAIALQKYYGIKNTPPENQ
jgi:hypothetical protein